MVESAYTADLKSADESLEGSSPSAPTIPMMIAWAAGIFEGEGSIFPVSQLAKGRTYEYVRMEVKMTDEDVILKFHRTLNEVGRIRFVASGNPAKRKDAWVWSLNNREAVEQLLEKFWPYLCERRRNRAIELGVHS